MYLKQDYEISVLPARFQMEKLSQKIVHTVPTSNFGITKLNMRQQMVSPAIESTPSRLATLRQVVVSPT